jgi:hypothetical protein
LGYSWYGGECPAGDNYPAGNNYNNYELFSAGGMDFIVVHLQYNPNQGVYDWASAVLSHYSDRIAILTMHEYLDTSANILVPAIWDQVIVPNNNVRFVLCGHKHGEAYRVDTEDGREVHQILADYQSLTPYGGNGFLRIMRFAPSENLVYVETYSPYLDEYRTGSSSDFTITFDMSGSTVPYEHLGTQLNVSPGTETSLDWGTLNLATGYEWYVTVTDTVTSDADDGPLWSFTTTSSNVTVSLDSPVEDQIISQNPVFFTASASCLVDSLESASLYLGSPAQAEDAQISADSPDTNMGDAMSINVDGATPHAHALIRFHGVFGTGPGQVPPGTTIDSATLGVNCTNLGAIMDLYRVTEDWSQDSVTWNTAPAYDDTLALPGDCSATGWRDMPVTEFVQAWSDGQPNYGVLLTDTGTDGVDFDSSEGITPPILEVTYGATVLQFTAASTSLEWVETLPMTGTSDTVDFTSLELVDGDYIWNCRVVTSDGVDTWHTWAPADAHFTVDGVPDPLVANAGPDQTVSDVDGGGDQAVTLDGSASTGAIVSYEWDLDGDGDTDTTGQSPTATLAVGDHTITLTVTDDTAATDIDTVTITVNANQIPTADAGPDQTVGFGQTVTLDGTGSTDDGTLSYEWTEGGSPIAMGATANVTLGLGLHTITLTVTDDAFESATDTVDITVEEVPLFSDGFESGGFAAGGWQASAQASIEGMAAHTGYFGALLKKSSSIETTIDAAGATTATLTFWARTDGLKNEYLYVEWFDGSTTETLETLTGTTEWAESSHEVTFSGSQGILRFFTNGNTGNDLAMIDDILITPMGGTVPNTAPSITSTAVTEATEDVLYSYQVVASDPDEGDTLTFSLDLAPTAMAINSATGFITWTPENSQVGDNDVQVKVTDSAGASDTQAFTVTVSNTNDAPTITSTPITSATVGVLYNYHVDATDPDVGDSLTYSLTTAPGGMNIDSGTGQITWTPVAAENCPVEVKVTDNASAFDTQSFTITVANVNHDPSITSTAVTEATEDVSYSYQVVASDPDEGDTLTFSLDLAPTAMAINSATGLITWTPDNSQVGDNDVQVKVTDSAGAGDTQSFTIAVSNTNDAPTITSTPVTSATVGVLYSYDVDATDPDLGDSLTYSLTTAPAGMTINSGTGQISWTPASGQEGGNEVVVEVQDIAGASDSQTYTITVQAAASNTITVAWIEMRKKIAGKNYFAQAVVTVRDQDDADVAGAVVHGEWYFNDAPLGPVVSNATAGDGKVTIDAPKQQVAGTFTFKVTNVVFGDYTYTPGITQGSVTVP